MQAVKHFLIALLFCSVAQAQDTRFADYVGAAITCNNVIDPGKMYATLTKDFGQPYKQAEGAYWWRAKATIFGQPVTEFFVSNDASYANGHIFVGAVFNKNPPQLVKALQQAYKTYYPVDSSPYPSMVSPGGSVILWRGEQSKLMCKTDVYFPKYN